MIYRAHDCALLARPDVRVDLWFQSYGDQPASERAVHLLAWLWEVPPDQVVLNGMPHAEGQLEKVSIEGEDAGERRWLQTGAHGRYPTYGGGQHAVVVLDAVNARRFNKALAAAIAHAADVAGHMRAELRCEEYALTLEQLDTFVRDGLPGYGPDRYIGR